MKRLTVTLAILLATLLVLRQPLFAQEENGNPDMGDTSNAGQDEDQQVAPDQPADNGDATADQGDDTDANQTDPDNMNDSDQANSENQGDDPNAASP